MSKICLACDINSDDNSLLADLNKNDIPLWSKKEGNYSLLPPILNNNDKYNAKKTTLQVHKPNITNWHNPKTNSHGIIKTTKTWYEGPIKCRTYESTISIEPAWPVAYFSSGPVRNTDFGVACILPDGRVMIK